MIWKTQPFFKAFIPQIVQKEDKEKQQAQPTN
jgi:hypothetical protein